MTRLGVASSMMWNANPEDMFQVIYDNGLTEMELWAQHLDYRRFSCREFADLAVRYPVNICLHSYSWDLNPASINEGIRKTSVEEIKKAIRKAYHLGAGEVTVHPGRMTIPMDRHIYEQNMRNSLEEIVDCSLHYGVTVSLEIMEKIPKEIYTGVEEMEELAKDLPCSFTLDIAHCDSTEEAEHILRSTDRISKLHISNRKGGIYHTTLDDGDFDFSLLFPKLEKTELPMIIEGFDMDNSFPVLSRNLNFLRECGGLNDEKINHTSNYRCHDGLFRRVFG